MQYEMRAEYNLSKLDGKVRGKYAERHREATSRANEQKHNLTPEHPGGYALDVEGIDLGVSTEEIVKIVREGRENGKYEENDRPNCSAVEDGESIKPRASARVSR